MAEKDIPEEEFSFRLVIDTLKKVHAMSSFYDQELIEKIFDDNDINNPNENEASAIKFVKSFI